MTVYGTCFRYLNLNRQPTLQLPVAASLARGELIDYSGEMGNWKE